jgi:hypothetical protein
MRLSKKQKVYLAILVLALGTMVVDRAFLSQSAGGGLKAETSTDSYLPPGELVFGATGPPDPNSLPPIMKITQRLEMLWSGMSLDLDEARDAFSIPTAWLAEIYDQHPLRQGDAVVRFAKSHQLRGVLVESNARFAVVDNHLLIVGQELDGFKLVAVDEDSATFAAGNKQVVLRLENGR